MQVLSSIALYTFILGFSLAVVTVAQTGIRKLRRVFDGSFDLVVGCIETDLLTSISAAAGGAKAYKNDISQR